MPDPDAWADLAREVDRWRAEGRVARFWLRDDDAVAPTPALERLVGLCEAAGAPVLLAVIPAYATAALANWLDAHPAILPCQHGFAHADHASLGEKAQELGLQRGLNPVLADLREGRGRLASLFGGRLRPVLVPPWNRIAPDLLADLPPMGFESVSTFGWTAFAPVPGLRQANCHVDIIDWKKTRAGHPHPKLVGDLVEALARSRAEGGTPIGILTHHLVHGEQAWSFLENLFDRTHDDAAVRWLSFDEVTAAN